MVPATQSVAAVVPPVPRADGGREHGGHVTALGGRPDGMRPHGDV